MIDGDAEIEPAFDVELEDILDSVRGSTLPDVGKSTTVTHDWNGCLSRYTEEIMCADAEQPMTLGYAIAATRFTDTIHHAFRHEEAVKWRQRKHLVSILVVTMACACRGSFLRLKVE
jgi:hypothetical protein